MLSLDLAGIIAGSGIRGQFEEKFKALLRDIEDEGGNVICFIDELRASPAAMLRVRTDHGQTRSSASARRRAPSPPRTSSSPPLRGACSLSAQRTCISIITLLRLKRGRTPDEYRKYIEKDAALERRFQPVQIDEPSVEATISILRGLKPKYEVHHGVGIADAALVTGAHPRTPLGDILTLRSGGVRGALCPGPLPARQGD